MPVISKIILGTVQFGLNYGINNTTGKLNQEAVNDVLSEAYRSGIRIVDSAEAYGDAHDLIGKFHLQNPDKIFRVITKLPYDGSQDEIEYKTGIYLKQLNVGNLEGLMFHSFKAYKAHSVKLSSFNELKANNTIKSLGVSIYTNEEMDEVIDDDSIDLIQLPFNLFDNVNLRGDLIKKAKDKNKIIHTRSTFLQGLLFTSVATENVIANALASELNEVRKIADDYNVSLQKIALNYCLQQKDIDNVLIGVDNLTHLNQNLNNVTDKISDEIVEKINRIKIKNIDLLNPALWNR